MATRSFIAKYDRNENEYTAIYCHWDGYPEGVGFTLRDRYNTDAIVGELLALGDISSLGDTLTATESYKMRGETDTDPRTFPTLTEMMDYYRSSWCEYGYIWESDARWDCYEVSPETNDEPPARFINLYKMEHADV